MRTCLWLCLTTWLEQSTVGRCEVEQNIEKKPKVTLGVSAKISLMVHLEFEPHLSKKRPSKSAV